ncbi:hypothetical protein, partial [Escherichia coli]|uniref:hypothetical protein n=1 Tax=Escherichia coli TaxID=562 RepID=UPI0039DF90E8
MNLTETKALAGIAEAALAGPTGATENAVVTLEYPEASTAVVAGTPVILIDPPTLSFDTWHVRTATYTVWIIAA